MRVKSECTRKMIPYVYLIKIYINSNYLKIKNNIHVKFLLLFSLKNKYVPPMMINIEPDKLKKSGNS